MKTLPNSDKKQALLKYKVNCAQNPNSIYKMFSLYFYLQ